MGERLHPVTQARIVEPPRSIAHRHPAGTEHHARPPNWSRRRATASRLAADVTIFFCEQFLQPGIVEHGVGFRRVFSSSSAFSRLASDTSRPLYLAFYL
jgi:hypothetical protein